LSKMKRAKKNAVSQRAASSRIFLILGGEEGLIKEHAGL